MNRNQVLADNERLRNARGKIQRQLDDGVAEFRIPTEDYWKLKRLHPELFDPDPDLRLKAWQLFKETPLGEAYMVVRAPREVRRSNTNKIIVK